MGAGLYSLGIPKDSIVRYETALKSDKFLVMAHGSADEVAGAKSILEQQFPEPPTGIGLKRGSSEFGQV